MRKYRGWVLFKGTVYSHDILLPGRYILFMFYCFQNEQTLLYTFLVLKKNQIYEKNIIAINKYLCIEFILNNSNYSPNYVKMEDRSTQIVGT